jgi:hypothetical protein
LEGVRQHAGQAQNRAACKVFSLVLDKIKKEGLNSF